MASRYYVASAHRHAQYVNTSRLVGSILLVSLVAGGWTMEMPMRKKFARAANLVREIATYLVPLLTVAKLIVEIADKVANCNDQKLQIQI
jgi:hypothetical protein